MLMQPTTGFRRSIKVHNVKIDILCDWIEGSVTFVSKRVTQSDLVDVLCENQIYDEQDMAFALIGDAWAELRKRASLLGVGSPFKVESSRVVQVQPWHANAPHAFCLMVSLQAWYKSWAEEQFGSDYTEQGDLFERITDEALIHEIGRAHV